MNSDVNIQSFQVLEDLKTGLLRFSSESSLVLNSVQRELNRLKDWLVEKQRYWQNMLRRAQETLNKAEAELKTCKSRATYSAQTGKYLEPLCTKEIEEVRRARNYLRDVEAEMRKVQEAIRVFEETAAVYQNQAQRLTNMINNDLPAANAYLGRKIMTIQNYATSTFPVFSGQTLISTNSVSTTQEIIVPANNIETEFTTLPAILAGPPKVSLEESELNLTGQAIDSISFSDFTFHDARGKGFTLRTFRVGNQIYLRVYNMVKTPNLPDTPNVGDTGYANLLLESASNGPTTRVRLQDIFVVEGNREAGIGNLLLEKVEGYSRESDAAEIYGDAPNDPTTRQWYAHRGYQFRENGRIVFKTLRF